MVVLAVMVVTSGNGGTNVMVVLFVMVVVWY